MTIRLAVEIQGTDYIAAILVGIDLLRVVHGRPPTFGGCCASCVKWIDSYGHPDASSLARWLNDLGPLADLELPDDLVHKVIRSI